MIGAVFNSQPSPFSEYPPRRSGVFLRFGPNDHLRVKGSNTAYGRLYTQVDPADQDRAERLFLYTFAIGERLQQKPADASGKIKFLKSIPHLGEILTMPGTLTGAIRGHADELSALIID